MRESKIEEEVGNFVKENGGLFYKFVSPGCSKVPDRLIILPRCAAFLIEFKATGKKSCIGQLRTKKKITDLGTHVYTIDNVIEGKNVIVIELKNRDRLEKFRSS